MACAATVYASVAVAQVTAPSLREGSTFALARPGAVASEVSAVALVELLIAANGEVEEAQIVDLSVSAPEANDATREAMIAHARRLSFQPAMRDGRSLASRTRIRLHLDATVASQAKLLTPPENNAPPSAAHSSAAYSSQPTEPNAAAVIKATMRPAAAPNSQVTQGEAQRVGVQHAQALGGDAANGGAGMRGGARAEYAQVPTQRRLGTRVKESPRNARDSEERQGDEEAPLRPLDVGQGEARPGEEAAQHAQALGGDAANGGAGMRGGARAEYAQVPTQRRLVTRGEESPRNARDAEERQGDEEAPLLPHDVGQGEAGPGEEAAQHAQALGGDAANGGAGMRGGARAEYAQVPTQRRLGTRVKESP
ncbi:MAG TPA: hypothetical protein VMF89_04700, partial [Polyangiales bacterium]|nr:hypothetical protein [Polyangiales bacterium]